jgi:hypothetical protein
MHEYQVHYGKVFSIGGVIYVRRGETNNDELVFSRTYPSLDGEVTRSLCMFLEARRRARVAFEHAHTVSGRLDSFSRLVGAFVLGWMTRWVRRSNAKHTRPLLDRFPLETPRVLILAVLEEFLRNLCSAQ